MDVGGDGRTGESGPEVRRNLNVNVRAHVEVEDVTEIGVRHKHHRVVVHAPVLAVVANDDAQRGESECLQRHGLARTIRVESLGVIVMHR